MIKLDDLVADRERLAEWRRNVDPNKQLAQMGLPPIKKPVDDTDKLEDNK